jgi:hypothetical protein
MNDPFRNQNGETRQLAFAGFLERLAQVKGHIGTLDWAEFAVTHYLDSEMEEMRQAVVRLENSWRGRDWLELNCELVLGFAKQLRNCSGP